MTKQDTLLHRLDGLDSCALSDACDQLGIGGRVVTGLTRFGPTGKVTGRAITVLLGPPRELPATRHLCAAAVEGGGRDDVIVVAHQGRSDCAGWGGTLSRAAIAAGVRATLVDGAVRDVDESIEVGYSVFATSTTPRTARGRAEEHAWNTTIEWAGVDVGPGDLVVADGSGVVVIPARSAGDVIDAAERIVARENAMIRDIAAGRAISEVMGTEYEQMLEGDAT